MAGKCGGRRAAVEDELHVAGSFELFKDDLVHARAGIDEGGGDDGERAALFDISRCAKEALRFVQGVGVDTAGEDFAGVGLDGVIGAGKTGDVVEEDNDIVAALDEAARFFDGHFGDLDVALGGFIEGGGDDFAFDGADHVGDLFGALVDEKDDEDHFGIIFRNGIGDILQKDGFPGLGGATMRPRCPFPMGVRDRGRGWSSFSLEVSMTRRLSGRGG